MSMHERPRQQDEREPDGSDRPRDEGGAGREGGEDREGREDREGGEGGVGGEGGEGGVGGEESYGGDPDAGPASTEQEAEQASERKPAEG